MNFDHLRVFISYPRGGEAHTWAEEAERWLADQGARGFRDETSIAEGEPDWCDCLEQGLLQADMVLAIIGRDSEVCRWQKRELLRADTLSLPLVALKVADVPMPFATTEKQPVAARRDRAATWEALSQAILCQRPTRQAASASTADLGLTPGQRQAEIEWLEHLVYRALSDRPERYVALSGRQKESLSSARAMKGLRMETHSILKAFRVEREAEAAVQEQRYSDVLDAYRELRRRPVRRLAVLGEPGAGKSFSLERIAVDYARQALQDEAAPVPLLVPLGRWTRDGETLADFIARCLKGLGRYLRDLIRQGRAVLLLDAINEIPPGQRRHKAEQIKSLAADERLASVIVSCREKDFAESTLPFDTLTLQPLSTEQIREFLQRFFALKYPGRGKDLAEDCFWRMAGGEAVKDAWEVWQRADTHALLAMPLEIPKIYRNTHYAARFAQFNAWRRGRLNPRSLLRLAANPYLLHIMAELGADLPANRARLFEGFLTILFERELKAREARHAPYRPALPNWLAVLATVAAALQRQSGAENEGEDEAKAEVQTSLPRADWPAALTPDLLDFSRDANVLELRGNALRFSHQLLQEYLASRLLLEASAGEGTAADYWPPQSWWQRNGWEVVAEIAAEACADDEAAFLQLLDWLAGSNPEVAMEAWRRVGSPPLPDDLLRRWQTRWLPRMTDPDQEPAPAARAAIGRALGRLGLDNRPGVGLGPDGLPDIAWIEIAGPEPFIYQDQRHPGLPTFWLAQYPVSHAQFQAFIDDGGYRDKHWWQGLARQEDAPAEPSWNEPNSPRETVNWFEAMAFCRWLSGRSGQTITLPTEQQWERAAAGRHGRKYPWGECYEDGRINCDDVAEPLGRTSAVGLFPLGRSEDGLLDLAGNVWEWCLNERNNPDKLGIGGKESRILRGGAWYASPGFCRAARRFGLYPNNRDSLTGFRVCRVSPIGPLAAGVLNTNRLRRWSLCAA